MLKALVFVPSDEVSNGFDTVLEFLQASQEIYIFTNEFSPFLINLSLILFKKVKTRRHIYK
jgi:hypothetical protein